MSDGVNSQAKDFRTVAKQRVARTEEWKAVTLAVVVGIVDAYGVITYVSVVHERKHHPNRLQNRARRLCPGGAGGPWDHVLRWPLLRGIFSCPLQRATAALPGLLTGYSLTRADHWLRATQVLDQLASYCSAEFCYGRHEYGADPRRRTKRAPDLHNRNAAQPGRAPRDGGQACASPGQPGIAGYTCSPCGSPGVYLGRIPGRRINVGSRGAALRRVDSGASHRNALGADSVRPRRSRLMRRRAFRRAALNPVNR
jgi:hypothetical protein